MNGCHPNLPAIQHQYRFLAFGGHWQGPCRVSLSGRVAASFLLLNSADRAHLDAANNNKSIVSVRIDSQIGRVIV